MLPNFEEMNKKELVKYAKDNNIDLGQAKSREDVLTVILNKYNNLEEGSNMEHVTNEMKDEMMAGEVNEVTEVPATDAKAEDKKVWHNAAGEEVSMSEFIREKFTVDNMSRKEISEKFEINYRTVYGATVNMVNDAEPASRGRGVVNPKITVTADNKVVTTKEEDGVAKVYVNGEEVAEMPETVETDRNTWIKEQVAAGMNRGDVAKFLDLSYGVVYGLTKEAEGARQKHEVEIEDAENPGQTKMVSRSEYIRMRVAAGISKSDVAKELGVEYSVVWQATKKDKTEAEKYDGIVESLEKMADKIEGDKDAFLAAVAALKAFKVAEPKAEEVNAEETQA